MWGNSGLERAWQETVASGCRGELRNVDTLAFALCRSIEVFCPEFQVAYAANDANRRCNGPELVVWRDSKTPCMVFACFVRTLGDKTEDLERYRNSIGFLFQNTVLQVPDCDTNTSAVRYRPMSKAPEFEAGAYIVAPQTILDAVQQEHDRWLDASDRTRFHFSGIQRNSEDRLNEAGPEISRSPKP
jgi:hypothetical protein